MCKTGSIRDVVRYLLLCHHHPFLDDNHRVALTMFGDSSSKGALRDQPTLTEKGYAHRRNVLRTQMQRTYKLMQQQMQLLDTLLTSGDTTTVSAENDTLRRLYQDITDANNQIASCVKKDGPSEADAAEDDEHSRWMEEIDTVYFEYKNRICKWLAEQNKAESVTSRHSKISTVPSEGSKSKLKVLKTPAKEEYELEIPPEETKASSKASSGYAASTYLHIAHTHELGYLSARW